jgi:hypothetical protein
MVKKLRYDGRCTLVQYYIAHFCAERIIACQRISLSIYSKHIQHLYYNYENKYSYGCFLLCIFT